MRYLIIGLALLILLPAAFGMAQSNQAAVQIDSITDQGIIVLGDATFVIAPDARFFAEDERTSVAFSTFQVGDLVEFSVNDNGQIDELWLSSE
jgi:hypothetical protein